MSDLRCKTTLFRALKQANTGPVTNEFGEQAVQAGEGSDIEIIEQPASESEVGTWEIKRRKKEEAEDAQIPSNVMKKRSESPEADLSWSIRSPTPVDDMSLHYPSSSVAPRLKHEEMTQDSLSPEPPVLPAECQAIGNVRTQDNNVEDEFKPPIDAEANVSTADVTRYPTTASDGESRLQHLTVMPSCALDLPSEEDNKKDEDDTLPEDGLTNILRTTPSLDVCSPDSHWLPIKDKSQHDTALNPVRRDNWDLIVIQQFSL
ncbi:hypothetical protein C0995_013631 [Termitomyces sp. Mi166|nr:hypothetical protein C0995_013631 [Termitomyces sp. Mi166\